MPLSFLSRAHAPAACAPPQVPENEHVDYEASEPDDSNNQRRLRPRRARFDHARRARRVLPWRARLKHSRRARLDHPQRARLVHSRRTRLDRTRRARL
eukprot:3655430-Pleurochrysis_carterae.AAC.1